MKKYTNKITYQTRMALQNANSQMAGKCLVSESTRTADGSVIMETIRLRTDSIRQ